MNYYQFDQFQYFFFLLLSPKITLLPFLTLIFLNLFLSPIICLEQALSKYHLSLKDLARRHTYNNESIVGLWHPNSLGSKGVSTSRCNKCLDIHTSFIYICIILSPACFQEQEQGQERDQGLHEETEPTPSTPTLPGFSSSAALRRASFRQAPLQTRSRSKRSMPLLHLNYPMSSYPPYDRLQKSCGLYCRNLLSV